MMAREYLELYRNGYTGCVVINILILLRPLSSFDNYTAPSRLFNRSYSKSSERLL